jgi:hypothetical protein
MQEILTYLNVWLLLLYIILIRIKVQPRKWVLNRPTYLNKYSDEQLWKLLITNRCLSYIHCVSCIMGSLILINYPNQIWSNILLNSSISYHIYDIFYNIIIEYNLIFQIHHICSIFILGSSLKCPLAVPVCLKGLLITETSSILLIPCEISDTLNWTHSRRKLYISTMCLYILIRMFIFPGFILYQLPTIYNFPSNKLLGGFLCYNMCILGLGSVVWTETVIRKCFNPKSKIFKKTSE